jgi:uncharacterized repeat protein (TIGR02543 family)
MEKYGNNNVAYALTSAAFILFLVSQFLYLMPLIHAQTPEGHIVIDSLSASPNPAYADQSITISVTVRNKDAGILGADVYIVIIYRSVCVTSGTFRVNRGGTATWTDTRPASDPCYYSYGKATYEVRVYWDDRGNSRLQDVKKIEINVIPVKLVSGGPSSQITVKPGETFTVAYGIQNDYGEPVNVGLGASICSGSTCYHDPANDKVVTISGCSSSVQTRMFNVPSNIPPGTYDLVLGLWSGTPGNSEPWEFKTFPGVIKIPPIYTITFSASGLSSDASGTILIVDGRNYGYSSLPCSFNWEAGSTHSYTWYGVIQAGTGKQYVWAYCSGLASARSGSITVSGSGTITAYYDTFYYLTMQANPPNGGTVSPGSGWYKAGTQVQISATPSSGYIFQSWTGSGSGSYTGTSNPATIIMNGPITEIANFPPLYSVTFKTNPTSGGVSITFSGTTYTNGQTASYSSGDYTATANAPSGYAFHHWEYSGSSGSGVYVPNINVNPTTVQVRGDGWLKAVFSAQIVFYTNPSNIGSIQYDSSTYTNGQIRWEPNLPPDYTNQVHIIANVPPGYTFSGWTTTGGLSVNNPSSSDTLLTVNGPGTLTANFQQSYYLGVKLNSATLNGQTLSTTNPELRVAPSSKITGTVTFTVENVQPGSWITPVIWVTSWERGTVADGKVRVVANDIRTTQQFTINIDVTAPSSPGTYYIGFFAGWMYNPDEVASNDHPPNYGDGDDVWDMPQQAWEEVLKNGQATTGPYKMPGRAIRIVVQDTIPPMVRVIAPNGGEVLFAGNVFRIKWEASDNIGVSKIHIWLFQGNTQVMVIASDLQNTGYYDWTIPNMTGTNYKIRIAAVDAAGNSAYDDSDGTFEIKVALPDLTIASLNVYPPEVYIGGELTVSWVEENQGNADAGEYFVGIYLGKTEYGMDYKLGQVPSSGLKAGSTISRRLTFTVPSTISPGIYYVTIFIDETDNVKESNENNNIRSAKFIIKAKTTITLDTPPPSVVEGQTVTFTGRLVIAGTNIGVADVTIKIFDFDDIGKGDLMGEGKTDSNGYFRITWSAKPMDSADRTVEVYAIFEGTEFYDPSRSPLTEYYTIDVIEVKEGLFSLPAGAKNVDPSNPKLDETRLLIDINIAGSGQTAYVNPGEIVSGTLTYQIYSGAGNPSEINQGFLIMSWTPSWPPPKGYYIPIWNGISGVYPGVKGTKSFNFTAPSTPGTYYLYWCGGAEYSMEDAVARYNRPLTLPAHAKIVVQPTILDGQITSVNPTSVSAYPGQSIQITFSIKNTGNIVADYRVYFAAGSLFGYVSGTITLNPSEEGKITLTGTVPDGTNPGNYMVDVYFEMAPKGQAWQKTQKWGSIKVNVIEEFDFTISVSPSSRTITAGQSTTYTITVTLTSGSTQPVSLSISGLPSGATGNFNPNSGNPTFTSTLTITTNPNTPTGTYTLTITGTGGGKSTNIPVALIVLPPFGDLAVQCLDVNGDPIPNVDVKLYKSDQLTHLKTQKTDFNGKTTFTGLSPDLYYVAYIPSTPWRIRDIGIMEIGTGKQSVRVEAGKTVSWTVKEAGLEVYVKDQTGKPVQGMEVMLYIMQEGKYKRFLENSNKITDNNGKVTYRYLTPNTGYWNIYVIEVYKDGKFISNTTKEISAGWNNITISVTIPIEAAQIISISTDKTQYSVGEKVNVSFTIKNTGNVRLHLCMVVEIKDPSDKTVYYSHTTSPVQDKEYWLDPEQQVSGSFQLTIPVGIPSGTYKVLASLRNWDDWNKIYDYRWGDKPGPTFKVLLPDLTVSSPIQFSPSSVVQGGTITVTWTEKNQGDGVAGSYTVSVYLATSEHGTDYLLGRLSRSRLDAGESNTYTLSFTIPQNIPPGNYYVTILIDDDMNIYESNENNNIGSSTPNKIMISSPTGTYLYLPILTIAVVGIIAIISYYVSFRGLE